MVDAKYAADKPSKCEFCYYWRGSRKGCGLGEENCFYKLEIQKLPKPKSKCDSCPYGPCVGWCMKKVMQEVGIH